jgi:glycosyltransferase involved in cell wall biosynthesis
MSTRELSPPLFSVVIPTFNRSDIVPLAIQSVLAQTFTDFEVVVCDNASTDDTASTVKKFSDPRVRYIRTPRHLVIADNWEFARAQAKGTLIIMLGDDDALVATALERFAHEHRRHAAEFLFSAVAEYRDRTFPGPDQNTLDCRAFSTSSRIVSADHFIRPLFSSQLAFDMHPSAYVFSRALAASVATRCGRFFQTNGVEYCAWPLASVSANVIVFVDAPLAICGRTYKSWGTNMVLANPGTKRIGEFVADVEQEHHFAPLRNFTMCNLRAEGILTAKSLLPNEFGAYQFDELSYLRETLAELTRRKVLGVDVSGDMDDLLQLLAKRSYSIDALAPVRAIDGDAGHRTLRRKVRRAIGALGGRRVRNWLRPASKALPAGSRPGFRAAGSDSGFHDILGCAALLSRMMSTSESLSVPSARPLPDR